MRLFLATVNARWMSRRSWLLPLLLIIGLAGIGAGAVGGTLVVVDSGATNDVEQLRLVSPAGTLRVFSGTSSPDGLVNGQSTGSIYLRNDGANGGRVYTNLDGNVAWRELARQNDREQVTVRTVTPATNPNPINVADHTVIGDNTSAGVVITLPVATQFPGRHLVFVRRVGAPNTNPVTINAAGGDTIVDEGASTTTLTLNNTRTFQQVAIVSEAPAANRWRIVGLPFNFALSLTSIVTPTITGTPDLTIEARNLLLDTTTSFTGTITLDSGDQIQMTAPDLVSISSTGDDLALSSFLAASLTAGDTLLLQSQNDATLESQTANLSLLADGTGTFEVQTGTIDITTNADDVNISALGDNDVNVRATDILNLDGDDGVTIDSTNADVDITADGSGTFTANTGSLALEATAGNVTIDALGGTDLTATATDALSLNGTNSVSVTSGSGTVDLLAQTSGSFTTTTGTLNLTALANDVTVDAAGGTLTGHGSSLLDLDGDNGATLTSTAGDVDLSAFVDGSFSANGNLTIDAINGLLDLDGDSADLQGTNGVAIGSSAASVDLLANVNGSFAATTGTLQLRAPVGLLELDGDTVDIDGINGVNIAASFGTANLTASAGNNVSITASGGTATLQSLADDVNVTSPTDVVISGSDEVRITSTNGTIVTGDLSVSGYTELTSLALQAVTTVGGSHAVGPNDQIICVDNSAGLVSVILPTAASFPGRVLRIVRMEQNVNAMQITPQLTDSIEGGAAGAPITVDNMHIFQEVQLVSEGVANNWKIIGVPFTTGLTGSGTITISEIMGNPDLLIDTANLDVDVAGLATVDVASTLDVNVVGATAFNSTGGTLSLSGNGATSLSSVTGTLALNSDGDANLTSANGMLTLEGEGDSSLTSVSGSLTLSANNAGQTLALNATGGTITLDTPALDINTAAGSLITIGSSGNDANTILTGSLDVDDVRINGNTITTLNATDLVLESASGALDASVFTSLTFAGAAASTINIGSAGNDATTTLVGSLAVDDLSLDGNTLTTTAGDLILDATSSVLDASALTTLSLGTSATNTTVDIATGAGGGNDINIGGSATDTLDIIGIGTVTGEWNVDDLNLDGNTISTDTADLVLESATDVLTATDFATLDLGTAASTLTFFGTTLDAANTDTVNLGTTGAGTSDVNVGNDATDTLDITGITTLTGTLDVAQLTSLTSLATAVRVVNAVYTVDATDPDHTVIGDTSGAGFTVTLPDPAAVAGRTLAFVRSGANALVLSPAAGTINGAASFTLDTASASNAATFVSDGVADWRLVSTSSTITNLDAIYLRRDGTNTMLGTLDMNGNPITNVTTVGGAGGTLDLSAAGTAALSGDNLDLDAVAGNVNLDATGAITVDAAGLLTLAGATVAINGDTTLTGTLDLTGDLDIGTGNFTVTAASGNTTIAGDLTVNGDTVDLADATSVDIGTAGPGTTDTNVGDDATDTFDVTGRSTFFLDGAGAEALRVDVNRNAGGANSMAIFARTIVTNAGSDTRGLLAEGTGDSVAPQSTTAGVIASGFYTGTVGAAPTIARPFVMGSDNDTDPGAPTNFVNAVGARGTAIRSQAGHNAGTLGIGANGAPGGRTIGAGGLATTDDTALLPLFTALDDLPPEFSSGLLAVNTDAAPFLRTGTLSTVGTTGGLGGALSAGTALGASGTAAVAAYNENTTANNFAIWASGNSRLEGDLTVTGTLTATTFSGALSFADLASGTNTAAAMTVDTGASLDFANAGTINASSLDGNTWASPQDIGTGTAADGTFNGLTSNTGLTVVAGGAAITGASSVNGTLNVVGDFSVNTTALTVVAASGNTVVNGTLTVNGLSLQAVNVLDTDIGAATGDVDILGATLDLGDAGSTLTFAGTDLQATAATNVDIGTAGGTIDLTATTTTVTGNVIITNGLTVSAAGATINGGITTSAGDLTLNATTGNVFINSPTFNATSAASMTFGLAAGASTMDFQGTQLLATRADTVAIGTTAVAGGTIDLGTATSTTSVVGRLDANTSNQISNVGNVPHWVSFTVNESAFTAGAGSESITLFNLPAGAVIHAIKTKHSTSFTGGGLSAFTVEVGVAGDTSRYTPAPFDVFQATGDTVLDTFNVIGSEDQANPTAILITATATGDTVAAAAAGDVVVWVLVSLAN